MKQFSAGTTVLVIQMNLQKLCFSPQMHALQEETFN